MLKLIFIVTVYIFTTVCKADDDSDKLWLLFDHTTLLECSGVTNQIIISKDDISITDKDGKLAYFLECPNDYTINFANIKVTKPLPNMSGQMATTIQVPLVSIGAGLSLDFPFQAIPQKKLLEGSQCDNESGVWNEASEKREYCRYCEICETSGHAEQKVGSEALGHKYTDVDPNKSFSKVCRSINAQQYSISKSVSVPGKKELEDSANANVKGSLDGQLEKKLKVGKGKLQIRLKLLSSTSAPTTSNTWYTKTRGCECCVKDASGNSKCNNKPGFLAGFAGGAFAGNPNVCLKCNNQFVQTCVTGQPQVVGCYTVEYNFRVTDKRSDVEQFKAQIDYNKNANKGKYTDSDKSLNTKVDVLSSGGVASSGSNTGASSGASGNTGANIQTGGAAGCSKCNKDACNSGISFAPTKSYCTSWWDTPSAKSYCCGKCSTLCPPGCC